MRRALVSTVLAVALVLGAAQPAFADGTQAGTVVLNTVDVDYEVLGVAQTTEQGTADFTVDRKIELTVVSANLVTYIQASPGQLQAIMEFDVTNDSNDVLDFRLSAVDELAAVVEPVLGGTDEQNAITLTAFHDVNANNTYEAGTDRLYVDELAIDATQRVLVAADIPDFPPAVNGDNVMISLIAEAREGGVVLTEGAALVNDPGPDNEDGAAQTVFIDIAGDAVADVAADAQHSDMWAFVILGANLTITKTSALIAPSVFHIPGATVEYTIVISNAAGSSNATNLDVTDVIPANTTYVAGSITLNAAAQTDASDSPTDESDFNVSTANAVSVLNNTVNAGASITITFRVTVD